MELGLHFNRTEDRRSLIILTVIDEYGLFFYSIPSGDERASGLSEILVALTVVIHGFPSLTIRLKLSAYLTSIGNHCLYKSACDRVNCGEL